jgi:hypothetical protein
MPRPITRNRAERGSSRVGRHASTGATWLARSLRSSAPATLRPFYAQAIALASASLDELDESIDDAGDGFALTSIDLATDEATWRSIAEDCAHSRWGGVECIVRHSMGCEVFAAHIEGVGSLVGRRWSNDSRAIDYQVGRDCELRRSYSDDTKMHIVAAAEWRRFYAGQALAEAGAGVAHVKALAYQGRRYVISGVRGFRRRCEGEAWSITRAEAWRGPTYSYRSQVKAWDEGRRERGDRRGLVVMVDRQTCVLDGFALFVDDDDTGETTGASSSDEGGEGECDGDDA